jgi:hypothetical protein
VGGWREGRPAGEGSPGAGSRFEMRLPFLSS